jgi:hypothetical protein
MNKTILYYFILCIVFTMIAFGINAQTTKDRVVVSPAKTVVMRDIHPINDPNFVAKWEHDEEDEEERGEEIRKKDQEPRPEHTYQPTIVTPIIVDGSQRSMINETPCYNFRGMKGGGLIPPDVSGAVGFDHVLLTENDSFRISDKSGKKLTQMLHQDGASIWSGLYSSFLFDPKIFYDPYENRWVHVIVADKDLASSAILIAVSTTPDPMDAWVVWSFDADADNNQWFDYPSVGFNDKWVVVNGLMAVIPGSGASQIIRTFVFNKSQLYYGTPTNITVFSTTGYGHIVPALTYDENQPDIWCVTNDDVDDNDLRFFLISGPVNDPSMTEEGYITVGSDWGNEGNDMAPQLGTPLTIDVGDHRIKSVVWRNGNLYTSQTIFLPDGDDPTTATIQIVNCDPASESVHEFIRWNTNSTNMYAYPNLTVNARGDLIMSCEHFTSGTYPSAVVCIRRDGDPNWYESTVKGGEDYYVNYGIGSLNRWGDYTMAAVDPSDDQSVWVIGEYSLPKNGPTSGVWGTWFAKICSGECFPNVVMDSEQSDNTVKKFEASGNVFGYNTIQPGAYVKLDAGVRVTLTSGFKALSGSKLRALIDGCNGPQ